MNRISPQKLRLLKCHSTFHCPCHPNREHTEGRVTVPPGTARDFLLLACVHVCPSYETWLGFQFRLQHLLQELYMWLGCDRCFRTVHLRQIVKHRSTEHLPTQADRGSSRLSPFHPAQGFAWSDGLYRCPTLSLGAIWADPRVTLEWLWSMSMTKWSRTWIIIHSIHWHGKKFY